MGVTNRFFPDENAPYTGNQALLAQYLTTSGMDDPVDATGRSDIDASADFIRLLAPPLGRAPPPARRSPDSGCSASSTAMGVTARRW